MARHILFTSQKGGVGKSTLARALAIALASEGRQVLLADFDVDQGTCLRWQAQRLARRLEPAIVVERFSKEAKLGRVSHRYDDVIMDTRGQYDELSLDLAKASDVIFLPSSFSPDDISPTLKVVEGLRDGWHPVVARRRRVLPDRWFGAPGAICALDPGNERHHRARCRAASAGWFRLAVGHRPHRSRSAERRVALDRDGVRSGVAGIHRGGDRQSRVSRSRSEGDEA